TAFEIGMRVVYANNLDEEDKKKGRTNKPMILLVNEVHEHVARLINMRHTDKSFDRPLAIKKALLESGLFEVARMKPDGAPSNDPRFFVKGQMSAVVANFVPALPNGAPITVWEEIKEAYIRPEEVPAF